MGAPIATRLLVKSKLFMLFYFKKVIQCDDSTCFSPTLPIQQFLITFIVTSDC